MIRNGESGEGVESFVLCLSGQAGYSEVRFLRRIRAKSVTRGNDPSTLQTLASQRVTRMPSGRVRRSGRIRKEIAVVLIGSDLEGNFFSEKTNTVTLSRRGAGVLSQYKLAPEQEVIIRRPDINREAEVRVVGVIGSQAGSYTYGLAFLEPSLDFWGLEFPPLSEPEKAASRSLLECSRCKGRETVDLSDLGVEVSAAKDPLTRSCKRCGMATVWTRAAGDAEETSASLPSGQEPRPSPPLTLQSRPVTMPPPAARLSNRRKHLRTKVNCNACIRRLDAGPDSGTAFENDIVVCEDMSRGGFRFKSPKRYAEKSMIEVAAPYSPGPSNIFVPAQIVFVQELAEQKLLRYGVAYVKPSLTPTSGI